MGDVKMFALGKRLKGGGADPEAWAVEFHNLNTRKDWRMGEEPILDWKGAFIAFCAAKAAKKTSTPPKSAPSSIGSFLKSAQRPGR